MTRVYGGYVYIYTHNYYNILELITSLFGVSILGGYPKNRWFTMENPIKMDDANGRERNRFQYMGVSSNGGSLKP